MSDFNQVYNAGKEGMDWYHVQQKFGDSYQTREAYESGKTSRSYSGTHDDRISTGEGLGLIMMLMIGFNMLAIVYSPFIFLAYILLLPIWPQYSTDYLGSEFIIYAMIFIIVVYLQSCLFEYLRARMVEARAKNYNWKFYYLIIFSIRILVPGLLLYLALASFDKQSVYRTEYFCLSIFVNLVLLWKVKILKEENRLFLTTWAYKKGEAIMNSKPYRPTSALAYSNITQLKIFYLLWIILVVTITTTIQILFPYTRPSNIDTIWLIIFALFFILAGLISRLFLHRISIVFLQHDYQKNLGLKSFPFFIMPLISCLVVVPLFVRSWHWSIMILLCTVILAIQIIFKINKFKALEERNTSIKPSSPLDLDRI